jgi:hypothetical protein
MGGGKSMRRPSFQFYHGDWRSNAKLRRCTDAQRGIWIDVMCLMADADEFGILRWPLKDISNAVPCRVAELKQLIEREVLKGADHGDTCKPLIYTPRHAGRDGTPVTLLPEQPGPIWYSSRMVRDAYISSIRGKGSRFGEHPKEPPNQRIGDGLSTASSSSPAEETKTSAAPAAEPRDAVAVPDCPHEQILALYHELLPQCPRVVEWNETRRGYMRARWREKAKPNGTTQGYTTVDGGLAYWRRFFGFVAKSKFLTGGAEGRNGRPPFCADLEWLIRPTNFTHVIEGKYHT